MFKNIFFFNLFFVFTGFSLNVQSGATEYDLKAAYIYNITKFIYWDTAIIENEFTIGIIGSSPIYEPLLEAVKTKSVNNKKIIIRLYTSGEAMNNCHILFIPKNTSASLNELLEMAKSKKIVTISEQEGYGNMGSAINFVTINNKLKFEVNTKTLELLGLKASAQFLKLAVIIN